jgi:hypothetical protein
MSNSGGRGVAGDCSFQLLVDYCQMQRAASGTSTQCSSSPTRGVFRTCYYSLIAPKNTAAQEMLPFCRAFSRADSRLPGCIHMTDNNTFRLDQTTTSRLPEADPSDSCHHLETHTGMGSHVVLQTRLTCRCLPASIYAKLAAVSDMPVDWHCVCGPPSKRVLRPPTVEIDFSIARYFFSGTTERLASESPGRRI